MEEEKNSAIDAQKIQKEYTIKNLASEDLETLLIRLGDLQRAYLLTTHIRTGHQTAENVQNALEEIGIFQQAIIYKFNNKKEV